MIEVNYNEITKKLNVSLNNENFDRVIEKNNYILFFCGDKLVQYIISNYGFLKNSLIYNRKLKKFLGKNILKFIK